MPGGATRARSSTAAPQAAAPLIGAEIDDAATVGAARAAGLGATVAHGWRVAGLSGVVDGSCVLTLQNERGRSHRIHLCRNDGRPQGLVYTESRRLVVMNGGQGDLPTEEGLAQAVAEVAHVLAANERATRGRLGSAAAAGGASRAFRGGGGVALRIAAVLGTASRARRA